MAVRPTKVRSVAMTATVALLLFFAFVIVTKQQQQGQLDYFPDLDMMDPAWKYPQPRGRPQRESNRRGGNGGFGRLLEDQDEEVVINVVVGGAKAANDGALSKGKKCGDYRKHAEGMHLPRSDGPLKLPFQRPDPQCRMFASDMVEDVIQRYSKSLADPDMRMLFTNCFPNTLDTTIRWHQDSTTDPRTFLVTGDIDAEWLRDSHRQLSPYIQFVNQDEKLKLLVKGAIATHADMVRQYPYCNAFHPPPKSGIVVKKPTNIDDIVYPRVNHRVVFECKYELDSLASFLGLSNEYYKVTGDASIVTDTWLAALRELLRVIDEQRRPTYSDNGEGTLAPVRYRFQRMATVGTETLNLAGMGNPVNANTSLIKSAFRPSDDATILQFFIPANAMMAVELKKTAKLMSNIGHEDKAKQLENLGREIEQAIWDHGVQQHPVFGKVFAYEVDGFGGSIYMDDANIPSLLALPDMGFVDVNDPVYVNTRKMILSKQGNPYYLNGRVFHGIGGPHIGVRNAWPMSHLVAIRTSNNEAEISELLELVKQSTSGLGLMHESVSVDIPHSFTRPWFSWANSEFAKTIFDVADRYPHLLFGSAPAPVLAKGGATAGQ